MNIVILGLSNAVGETETSNQKCFTQQKDNLAQVKIDIWTNYLYTACGLNPTSKLKKTLVILVSIMLIFEI